MSTYDHETGEMIPSLSPVRTSGNTDKLDAQMAKAWPELRNPKKEKLNPHFRNAYADIADGLSCVRPILGKHGIVTYQAPYVRDGFMFLCTRIAHAGQWIESDWPLFPVPGPKQSEMGSAMTYARRQGLFALVGIHGDAEDDDGQEADKIQAPAANRAPAKGKPTTKPVVTNLVVTNPDAAKATAEAVARMIQELEDIGEKIKDTAYEEGSEVAFARADELKTSWKKANEKSFAVLPRESRAEIVDVLKRVFPADDPKSEAAE